MTIRTATRDDAAACAAIYRPYVLDTAITFELEPPSDAQMADRIEHALTRWDWIVATDEQDRVIGYAYGGEFRSRPAYRFGCEVSVYVDVDRRRTGAGRRLYTELISRLSARGFHTVIGGLTLPNAASVGLHTALGFSEVGVFREVGWKLGRWHDVGFFQLHLDRDDHPAEPQVV